MSLSENAKAILTQYSIHWFFQLWWKLLSGHIMLVRRRWPYLFSIWFNNGFTFKETVKKVLLIMIVKSVFIFQKIKKQWNKIFKANILE